MNQSKSRNDVPVLGVEVTPAMFQAGETELERQGIALDPASPPIDVGDVYRVMLRASRSETAFTPDAMVKALRAAGPYLADNMLSATGADCQYAADAIERIIKANRQGEAK